MRIFGIAFVNELSGAQPDMVAMEDTSRRQPRKSLTAEIEALERGKKVLEV